MDAFDPYMKYYILIIKNSHTYAVLSMSAWRLYSLANIKGTIPSGREAYKINYTMVSQILDTYKDNH